MKTFTCFICKKRRLRKSAWIHPRMMLCRRCVPSVREWMEDSGYVMEEYFLELFCLAEEAALEKRKKRVMGSGLRNVMEVPTGWPGQKWLCDIRTDGCDAGMRVAFVLRENNSVESQLEWVDQSEEGDPIPEKEQGLVIALRGTSGTATVPRRVLEWLMTGQV